MSNLSELKLELVRIRERIKDLKAIAKDIKRQLKDRKDKNEYGNSY